ncbi:hypothetical protein B0A50_03048 [Salinomyces thailandicus]|uniref:Uncharacterized protein n=1 Tax=Salinomyces thailandicus TaxID=706561 RepID=A0A4U0U1D3_9PEZI|nr:hypothetical protein B0A50_03048 [Salinomyces thailandica]
MRPNRGLFVGFQASTAVNIIFDTLAVEGTGRASDQFSKVIEGCRQWCSVRTQRNFVVHQGASTRERNNIYCRSEILIFLCFDSLQWGCRGSYIMDITRAVEERTWEKHTRDQGAQS